MTSVRRRRKVRNPNSKVSRRNRVVKKTGIREPTLEQYWDAARTVEQNFDKAGLANRVNADVGKRAMNAKLQEWNWKRREMVQAGELAGFDSEEEIFKELETFFGREPSETKEPAAELERKAQEAAANVVKEERRLGEGDREYIQKLVDRHGTDYDRMFMDIKLNTRQLTAHQLQKMAGRR